MPVRLCDERLTTVSAESILREQGRHGAKRRAVVDQAAAVLILQTALDTERVERAGAGRDRRGEQMSEHADRGTRGRRPTTSYEYVPGRPAAQGPRRSRAASPCSSRWPCSSAGFYFGLTKGVGWVADQFQGPEDYPGPGTGKVEFTVNEGDTVAQMGRNLKEQGVTKSVQAFIDAAAGEPDSQRHPGRRLRAPEGDEGRRRARGAHRPRQPHRLPDRHHPRGPAADRDRLDARARTPTSPRPRGTARSSSPTSIGLPDYAEGNAEGYLFPATYEIKPGMKPVKVLHDDGRPLAAGRRRRRPRGQGGRAGQDAGRADDHRLARRGRGPRRRHAQDRPRHLQPPRRSRRQGRHQRHAAASTPPSPTASGSRPARRS